MKELIVDGRTGFLVHNTAEAVDAVGNISSISREECRQHAMDNFSSQIMAEHYIGLYKKITGE